MKEVAFSLTWDGLRVNRNKASIFIGYSENSIFKITNDDKNVLNIDGAGNAEFGGSIIVQDDND
jgi:hypothetical protein